MPARQHMTMRALIERGTTVTDEYGNPGAPTWASHIASLACWLYSRVEREVMDTRKTAVVEDLRMLIPRGSDVRESDRINGVTDRRGSIIHAGVLLIESVVRRVDHLELAVRKIAA